MKIPLLRCMFFLFVFAAECSILAAAQSDIGLSAYGTFSSAAHATLVDSFAAYAEYLRPANAAGGMLELRHIHSAWVGVEATYSLNRANQLYLFTSSAPTPPFGRDYQSFPAYAHELTGDWIVSNHLTKSVRGFALAGVGIQITAPTNSPSGSPTATSTTPSYIYGFGTDWQMLRHIGLRAQYRGDIHKAPQIDAQLNSPNSFIHTAEPMVGVYYRF